ncbi:TetR/AcrR family transcriptional regulator [Actinopolymorpha pittospori]|uniref:AcrR family transcriptional regulator n=1 Tax=Actinopolymorpha pittospori TaxID=648752 RepID=A0A927RK60_9ACTN|nr:TetR/AcrR family transcriptional regulator [Actinopolymorpha pittospori]MBE1607921.1 AcrR family transcriptional regulator [Actinopolymorpha pittospori]
MGRPPQHDIDSLLDTAARLVIDAGPRSVTMSAVARAAGAPSGSVYHRFPSRPALLAALWLRALDRFHAGFLHTFGDEPPLDIARAAARHVVAWCRANPHDAAILLYNAADFEESEWPAQAREHLRRGNRSVARAIRDLAANMGCASAADQELVRIAVVDVPYSVVRRYYRSGKRIPRYAEDLAEESAAALLRDRAAG